MRVTTGPELVFDHMDGVSAQYKGNGKFFINASGLTRTQLECVKACLANLLQSKDEHQLVNEARGGQAGCGDGNGSPGPTGG
jgi:hypothetical protein